MRARVVAQIFYKLRYCGVTFTARDWLKTFHDNAALKWVPRVRFKLKDLIRTSQRLIEQALCSVLEAEVYYAGLL